MSPAGPGRRVPGGDEGPRPLSRSLDEVVSRLGSAGPGRRGRGPAPDGALGRVLVRWPEIAGRELAARVRPVAVRDGVLTVAAERAAWATEARRHQAGLLAAAGRRAGVRVTRLRVVVRPRPGPAEGPGSHRTGAPGG